MFVGYTVQGAEDNFRAAQVEITDLSCSAAALKYYDISFAVH